MAVKSQYLQCSSFEIPGVQWGMENISTLGLSGIFKGACQDGDPIFK